MPPHPTPRHTTWDWSHVVPFQLPLTRWIQISLDNHASVCVGQSSAKQRAAWKALRSRRNPHPIYQVKNSAGWELSGMKL